MFLIGKGSSFLDSQKGFHFCVVWSIACGGFYFMVLEILPKNGKKKQKQT